jgi:hypothetical protein
MFGRFKRKARPEDDRAFQQGHQMAQEMASSLDEFMTARFAQANAALLDVLRGRLDGCREPADAPPLIVARIQYEIFLEQLQELRPRMLDDTNAAMAKWLELGELVGVRSDFDRLIKKRIDDLQTAMSFEALEVLMDRVDELKVADEKWRGIHRVLSARFPPMQQEPTI